VEIESGNLENANTISKEIGLVDDTLMSIGGFRSNCVIGSNFESVIACRLYPDLNMNRTAIVDDSRRVI
jgi:hypothetical protein